MHLAKGDTVVAVATTNGKKLADSSEENGGEAEETVEPIEPVQQDEDVAIDVAVDDEEGETEELVEDEE